jgi:hypothetical protein
LPLATLAAVTLLILATLVGHLLKRLSTLLTVASDALRFLYPVSALLVCPLVWQAMMFSA